MAVAMVAYIIGFGAVGLADWKYRAIPTLLLLGLALTAILDIVFTGRLSVGSAFLGLSLGVFLIVVPSLLSRTRVGSGDFIVGGLAGVVVGYPAIMWVFALAFGSGLLYIGLARLRHQVFVSIPLAGFIAAAAVAAVLI